jgi:hypothetical protein
MIHATRTTLVRIPNCIFAFAGEPVNFGDEELATGKI